MMTRIAESSACESRSDDEEMPSIFEEERRRVARRGPARRGITSAEDIYAGFTLKSRSPNSTGLPLSTSTSRMTPETSASISFISFIASTMQSTCPALTR